MLRKTAVVATASAVLLAANLVSAQGVAPNVGGQNMGAGNVGVGPGAADPNMQAVAEFTGTIKSFDPQEKVLTMDNGDKYYWRNNAPLVNEDLLRPGNKITLHYVIDPAFQNERVIRTIGLPVEGPPRQP